VIRDPRIPNVVLPARSFKPYEAPEASGWELVRTFLLELWGGDLTGPAVIHAAILGLFLLLLSM
jgi:hypothetical protein